MFTKKEKEILEVKHKGNVSFLETRKIVGIYMGENSYTSVARKADTTNEDKYGTLVWKLIHLEANDWPKFQEYTKKLHRPNFTKQQLCNCLGMGRDPML